MTNAVPEPPKGYRAPLACFIVGALAFCVFAPVAAIACLYVSGGIDLALYGSKKLLGAVGMSIHADRPDTTMAFVVVISAAIASFGAFLVLGSMVWSTVRFGPHHRVSRVWKQRVDARRAAAPVLTTPPAPPTSLDAGPAPAAATLSTALPGGITGGDPLDPTAPEVWKG